MPFSFYIAKALPNDFALQEQAVPEFLIKSEDCFTLLLSLSKHYLPTMLKNDEQNLMLLAYLEQALSEEKEVDAVLLIQQKYKALLEPETIQILIGLFLVARNVLIKQSANQACDTQVAQFQHMKAVQKRLFVMIQVVSLLSDDLYNELKFMLTRTQLSLALFEDARAQLENIGYGLYYMAYQDNFESFNRWFNINWSLTQKMLTGLTLRIRTQGMPQHELQLLLPVFEASMNRWRYAAAFYFAGGENEYAKDLLKESVQNNSKMRMIFNCAKLNATALVQYEAILAKHASNFEGFTLDTPLNQYRQLCVRMLNAIQVLDKSDLECDQGISLSEKELKTCILSLKKISNISELSVPVIEQSIGFLHLMWLLKYNFDKDLSCIDIAKSMIVKLNELLESAESNAVLIKVQAHLLKYTRNMQIFVEKIEPKKMQEQEETQAQLEKEIKTITQELINSKSKVESAKKELLKATNQHKSIHEMLRSKKRKEQKLQEQIIELEKNIAAFQVKNLKLHQEFAALNSKTSLVSSEHDFIVLEQSIQAQKEKHEKEIEHWTSEYKKPPQQVEKERQLQGIEGQLVVLQSKIAEKAAQHKKELAKVKLQHSVELDHTQAKAAIHEKQVMDFKLAQEKNKELKLAIQALENVNKEQDKPELVCNVHVVESQVSKTVIQALDSAIQQKQKQLGQSAIGIKMTHSGVLEFSGDLAKSMHADVSLVPAILSLYLQLNKSISEPDYMILYESLPKVLLACDLAPYLALFDAIANHSLPVYSFNKMYHDNLLSQIIPLQWPNPQIIQDWLKFVNMRLLHTGVPLDLYEIMNLVLIAPYYALAQTIPGMAGDQLIAHLSDNFVRAFLNLNKVDKNLLTNHIQAGLHGAIIHFESWIVQQQAVFEPPPPPILHCAAVSASGAQALITPQIEARYLRFKS